ncbi:MSMEG_4193 family putative phosphomutase [Tessaracoccus rhinocerotis]|uniref:MSMEG_4193 family putative phosphomutase n=1 Tax=Tessaracoccus rhinocerotis TaxID=1689449 RepID=A0A553K2V6_9ACTN|nr:MSMEG_4193 family putative phosphomutase [Tessaracoccus rhinocerotis]TRY19043.1 MSMEG_4193 family putative phosphomutase [Tessaracoccus rhinocerotis]
MTTLVLVRHGRSRANADGVLAGRADGVELDDVGRQQAQRLGELLSGAGIAAAYRSPILRCAQTAEELGFPEAVVVDGLSECDYGEWTNRKLADLTSEPLWRTVQDSPSQVRFPGGESMLEMRDRCVSAVADIVSRHPGETVLLVSHGDPIKAILSDALGQRFDDFQRLNVAPASVSVVSHAPESAPFVVCVNANTDVAALLAPRQAPTVGGGDTPEK